MATILDIGVLQKFELIFPFLFVLVLIWGILSYSKFLGDNKFLHGIIALALGLIALFSEPTREIINGMAPWFVLFFIFILFILISIKIFGVTDSEIAGGIKGRCAWVIWTLVGIFLFIFIFSIIDIRVWNEETQDSESVVSGGDVDSGSKSAFFATMRHPNMLGLILLLIIATFTIQKLSVQL